MPDTPDIIVRRASALRSAHYIKAGAHPLDWSKLTDAQKLPWLLQAAEWKPEERNA